MQSIVLAVAVVLFPIWGPLWEKAPLTQAQLEQKALYSMDEALYQCVREQIASGDVGTRRRMYSALSAAPIPANRDFLLNYCLKREKNSELKASILRFMHGMEPDKVLVPLLVSLLKSDAPVVAFEAMRLYCLNPEAKAAPLMEFLGTPEQRYHDELLEKTAWNAFAENDAFATSLGKRVFEFRKSNSQAVRLLALRAALGQKKRDPQLLEWMEEALADNEEMRLALAQDRHPTSTKIPMKLLKDKNLVIRQALCESQGIRHLPSVLFSALNDKASSVRCAALKSIAFLDKVPEDGASKVFPLLNDVSLLVGNEAENALVAMAPMCNVNAVLENGVLSSAEKMTRFHSLNVARRIGAKEIAGQIALELSDDDSPEIIAASLDALSVLAKKGEYAQKIIPFSKHQSSLVRQMAARAMGSLQLPNSEDELISLGKDYEHSNVCAEAVLAMGHFPKPVFIASLVACLRMTSKTTFEARANAAWALGRIQGADAKALLPAAKRLKDQCLTQVIRGEEPSYDNISVIANSLWTIAALAKRTGNPEIRACYNAVVKAYDVSLEVVRNPDNGDFLPRSEMTCCMIGQIRQFFEGREYTTMPMPTQQLELPVRHLK